MISSDKKRHVLKSFTWRISATLITILISWICTSNIQIALNIGVAEVILKMIIYYYHERLWFNKMRFKKTILKSANLFPKDLGITRIEREKNINQKALTIWLSGLSGSGKSTIAKEVDKILFEKGYKTFILDGDNIRWGINADLSFDKIDREENIRRVAEISKLFNDAGIIVITAFISPYESIRQMAKTIISEEAYKEIYVDTSLEDCIRRDIKGLYKKAQEGKIKHFTGVNDPYDIPKNPFITVNGGIDTVSNIELQAQKIVDKIENYIKIK